MCHEILRQRRQNLGFSGHTATHDFQILCAGNLTGRTQTLPLAIYTALESDVRAAQALSLVLLALACALLFALRIAFTRMYGVDQP